MQKCSGGVRGDAQQGTEGWVNVLRQHCADLEVGLAQEHQHRVRQEREKVSSSSYNKSLSMLCQLMPVTVFNRLSQARLLTSACKMRSVQEVQVHEVLEAAVLALCCCL